MKCPVSILLALLGAAQWIAVPGSPASDHFSADNWFLPAVSQTPTDPYEQAVQLALEGKSLAATRKLYVILQHHPADSTLQRMMRDVYDLLTVSEKRRLQHSPNPQRWLLRFWRRNDPTPATLENERFVEHCRRLQHARKYFSSPQPRGYDDRGMIYVRYGEPEERYVSEMADYTRDNESWVYHRLGEVAFDFVSYGGTFRLEEDLWNAMLPGEGDVEFVMYKLYQQRQDISILYQRTAFDLQQALNLRAPKGDKFKVLQTLMHSFTSTNLDRQWSLPPHVSEFRIPDKPLRFAFTGAAFKARKRSERRGLWEAYYAVPLQQFRSAKAFESGHALELRGSFSVLSRNYDLVAMDSLRLGIDPYRILAEQDYLGQLTFFLEPDTYRVALDIQSPATHQRGMQQLLIVVPPFPNGRFNLSDIELASEVRKARPAEKESGFCKGELFVRPYPYRVVRRQHPVSVYFEIYDLALDNRGASRYTVTIEVEERGGRGLLASLNPFGGKKTKMSLAHQYRSTEKRVQQYTLLDFSDLHPGRYRLRITVRDEVRGEEVEKTVSLKLLE